LVLGGKIEEYMDCKKVRGCNDVMHDQRGFTVLEMIVVVGIIGVILGVVVLNRGDLQGKTEVKNIAYEIALVMRTTQTLGSNGKVFVPLGEPIPYGMHIVPNSTNLVVFADEDASLTYDIGEATVQEYDIAARNVVIDRFCVVEQSNNKECSDEPSNKYTALDISFARPDVTPFFRVFDKHGNLEGTCCPVTGRQVRLRHTDGSLRTLPGHGSHGVPR